MSGERKVKDISVKFHIFPVDAFCRCCYVILRRDHVLVAGKIPERTERFDRQVVGTMGNLTVMQSFRNHRRHIVGDGKSRSVGAAGGLTL